MAFLLVSARQQRDGGRRVAAQRARIVADVCQPQLFQFLWSDGLRGGGKTAVKISLQPVLPGFYRVCVPGEDDLLFVRQGGVVVEGREADSGRRIAERPAAEIELALLERHETGRCEEAAPATRSISTNKSVTTCSSKDRLKCRTAKLFHFSVKHSIVRACTDLARLKSCRQGGRLTPLSEKTACSLSTSSRQPRTSPGRHWASGWALHCASYQIRLRQPSYASEYSSSPMP